MNVKRKKKENKRIMPGS